MKAILTRSDVTAARRLLQDLARRLATDYPSAAASVREGLDVPLTVIGLRLSKRLQRSLATTNAIESLLSRTRHVQRHVKRWRGGTMVLRWVAAGVLEAANGFRRVNGCQDMPTLVAALRARDGGSRSSPGRWRTWPRTTGRSPRRYALNGDDPTGGPGAQARTGRWSEPIMLVDCVVRPEFTTRGVVHAWPPQAIGRWSVAVWPIGATRRHGPATWTGRARAGTRRMLTSQAA